MPLVSASPHVAAVAVGSAAGLMRPHLAPSRSTKVHRRVAASPALHAYHTCHLAHPLASAPSVQSPAAPCANLPAKPPDPTAGQAAAGARVSPSQAVACVHACLARRSRAPTMLSTLLDAQEARQPAGARQLLFRLTAWLNLLTQTHTALFACPCALA